MYENPLWLPRVIWADWLPPAIRLDALRGTFSREGVPSERMGESQPYGPAIDRITSQTRLIDPQQLATLRIRSIGPNEIVLENTTRRGGTLLVSQNAFPGWVARAGAAISPLERLSDFNGTAEIPAGAGEIRIQYRPFSFRLGAYLSALTLAAWIALLIAPVGGPRRIPYLKPERCASNNRL